MKNALLLLLTITLALPTFGQGEEIPIINAEDLMDAFHEKAANRIEDALREDPEPVDSVAWVPDLDAWEDAFRSSEWETVISDFPKGRRMGCICMDGTPKDDKGQGACAGYGGVRFWLYETSDSLIMHPTERHYEHPEPFTEEEKQNLSAYNEKGDMPMGAARNDNFGGDFANIVMVLMVCATIGYIARLYFTHGTD